MSEALPLSSHGLQVTIYGQNTNGQGPESEASSAATVGELRSLRGDYSACAFMQCPRQPGNEHKQATPAPLACLPGHAAAASNSPLLLGIESLLGDATASTQDRVVLRIVHPGIVADAAQLEYSLQVYAPSADGSDPPPVTLPLSGGTGEGTLAAPLIFMIPAK